MEYQETLNQMDNVCSSVDTTSLEFQEWSIVILEFSFYPITGFQAHAWN